MTSFNIGATGSQLHERNQGGQAPVVSPVCAVLNLYFF